MDDLLVKIITSLGVGLIAGLPVAWLLKLLYNSFIAPFRRTKLLIKAREDGRMVVGHLVDFHFHQSNENAGIYENKVYNISFPFQCQKNRCKIHHPLHFLMYIILNSLNC